MSSLRFVFRTLNVLADERKQRIMDLAVTNQQVAVAISQRWFATQPSNFQTLLATQRDQIALVSQSETLLLDQYVNANTNDAQWMQLRAAFELGFAQRHEALRALWDFNQSWTQFDATLVGSIPPNNDQDASRFLKAQTQLLSADLELETRLSNYVVGMSTSYRHSSTSYTIR